MSFKYINPGYVSLTQSKDMTQSTLHAALNGLSMVSAYNTESKFFVFNSGDKFYFRFNVYFGGTFGNWGRIIGFKSSSEKNGNTFEIQYTSRVSPSGTVNNNFDFSSGLTTISGCFDIANGTVQMYQDEVLKYNYSGTVFGGVPTDITVSCYLPNTNMYYSDFIISDSDVMAEKVAVVPVKSTVLNGWTANSDGTYTTSDAGNKLLQTLDVDTLKTNIGTAKSIVYKSISINGIPAYCDSGTLNQLKTVVTDGTNTSNPETQTLTTSTSAVMRTEGIQNPLTAADWTESALRGVSIGVESAESS